ncbi:MAG: clostripain-related cysteine peptidase, partial [Armatimonadota bacterium]
MPRPLVSLVVTTVAMVLVAGCGSGGPPEANGSGGGDAGEWTVLAYVDADGDLEDALIGDFNEMEVIGSTYSVNVVAQMDRHPAYDTTNGNWVTCRRFLVQRDPSEPVVPQDGQHNHIIVTPNITDIGEVNMGAEDTLVDFVEWGMTEYPGERYFLVLVDHGWGWQPRSVGARDVGVTTRGVMFDETSGMDSLSNAELKSALQRIKAIRGKNLEILGLDASEEALLEVAYQVRDTVDYLVASQLSEPNDGYPYDAILHRLDGNPTQSTETFLLGLLQDYLDSYEPGQHTTSAGSSVTLTVFREDRVAALAQSTDALAQALQAELPGAAQDLVDIRT